MCNELGWNNIKHCLKWMFSERQSVFTIRKMSEKNLRHYVQDTRTPFFSLPIESIKLGDHYKLKHWGTHERNATIMYPWSEDSTTHVLLRFSHEWCWNLFLQNAFFERVIWLRHNDSGTLQNYPGELHTSTSLSACALVIINRISEIWVIGISSELVSTAKFCTAYKIGVVHVSLTNDKSSNGSLFCYIIVQSKFQQSFKCSCLNVIYWPCGSTETDTSVNWNSWEDALFKTIVNTIWQKCTKQYEVTQGKFCGKLI